VIAASKYSKQMKHSALKFPHCDRALGPLQRMGEGEREAGIKKRRRSTQIDANEGKSNEEALKARRSKNDRKRGSHLPDGEGPAAHRNQDNHSDHRNRHSVSGGRAEKRMKSKKTKHDEADDGLPSSVGNASDQQKLKRSKREKRSRDECDKAPAGVASRWNSQPVKKRTWASVGDHELACNSDAFPRNFYVPSERTLTMGDDDVKRIRKRSQISCDPPHYKPITHFGDVNFTESVMESVRAFSQPSPIQSQTFPICLSGEDMVGIAATGSGKTLAFGLPALVHVLAQQSTPPARAPRVLILSPTRELALQTAGVMKDSGLKCGVKAACVYGGANKKRQLGELLSDGGSRVVVATPGRLQDFVQSEELRMDYVTYLVIDEADRMLDLGFEEAMRDIIGRIRSDRQTLMFSATWPTKIQSLASEFLAEPVHVRIGGTDELKAAHSVRQIVEVVQPHEKESALDGLLQQYHAPQHARVLVFALYKKEVANLEKVMRKRGWDCKSIHGDMPQYERSATISAFKEGSQRLLIATDVAARGLDIPNVECVINYTFPLTAEDYVHRIGRTGRAGAHGTAHTLFTKNDKSHAGELRNLLRDAGEAVPDELEKFGGAVKPKKSSMYGDQTKRIDTSKQPTKVKFSD
jgi:ATP-dependent RNA helicase DBP3